MYIDIARYTLVDMLAVRNEIGMKRAPYESAGDGTHTPTHTKTPSQYFEQFSVTLAKLHFDA